MKLGPLLEEILATPLRGVSLCELSKKHQWNNDMKSRPSRESVRQAVKASSVRSASALQVSEKTGHQKCVFCEQQHDPAECQDAAKLTVEERRQRLLASGCCFFCACDRDTLPAPVRVRKRAPSVIENVMNSSVSRMNRRPLRNLLKSWQLGRKSETKRAWLCRQLGLKPSAQREKKASKCCWTLAPTSRL